MVEQFHGKEEVAGSIPVVSILLTNKRIFDEVQFDDFNEVDYYEAVETWDF